MNGMDISGDIIIFSETLLDSNTNFNLSNYRIFYSSDQTIETRGILIHIKNNVEIKNFSKVVKRFNKKSHIELIYFEIINNNTKVITGYKSPGVTRKDFAKSFSNIIGASEYKKNYYIRRL